MSGFVLFCALLSFFMGIPVVILMAIFAYHAAKRKEKEEYERKLLLQNPEAWKLVQDRNAETAEKNKDRAAGAAKVGIGLALRLLKK